MGSNWFAELDKTFYLKYLESPEWRVRRADALLRGGSVCCRCGTNKRLEVHHKTYERLGNEKDEDLEVLCHECHPAADRERAIKSQRRSAAALYNARLDGWASKKYGEDWADRGDTDRIEEEFGEWTENHEY